MQLTPLLPWQEGLVVVRGCLLELRNGKKQMIGRGRFEREDLWDPQEVGQGQGQEHGSRGVSTHT